jgi:protein TonB
VASVPAPSQPSRNPEPIPAPAVSSSASEVKPSSTAAHNTPAAAAPEPPKKPALGDVHLAAPVVNRGANSQADSEPLPSIDANAAPSSDGLASVAASHRPQPSAPIPVGGDVQAAQLIKSVAPMYPQLAKTQHITGNVTIDCFIDANGNVADLKVLSGPPLLHRAATDAVKQWKYKPAILDGQPTSMHLNVTVQFKTQ